MTSLSGHVILQISGHRATNVHAHILFRVQEYKWSMVYHIKMKIHKIVSLAFVPIFLYDNLQIYGKKGHKCQF